MLKICVTGHRNLANIEEVNNDIKTTLLYLIEKYKSLEVYSSLATGADTIFAKAAIENHINLNIVLPFQLQEYKKDFTGGDLKTIESLIENKKYIEYKTIISLDTHKRNQAYLDAGKHLVDKCDLVVAVWDGKQALGVGGTGDIVNYSKESNKELHIIKAIRTNHEYKTDSQDKVQLLFDTLDRDALIYKKKKFEPTWIIGIVTGVLAAFCFAFAIAFPYIKKYELFLSLGEVIFLTISFISLTFFANKWKAVFLEKRRNAEYLRTILWYKDAGIPIPEIDEVDYKPNQNIIDVEAKIKDELKDINNFENAKRVAWSLAQEQIDYHKNTRIEKFEKKLHIVEIILKWIKILFVIVVISILVYELFENNKVHLPDMLKYILKFCWLIMPPIYAAFEGVKYFSEWKRNIAISKKTIRRLELIKKEVMICDDLDLFKLSTKKLREVLELENSDWAERYDEKEVEFKS